MGRVELLQKRAVGVISCTKYNAHTDPIFKQPNLMKVKDIFPLNILKLFYKLNQSCLPVYITDLIQNFSLEHDHNARQSLVLNYVFSSSRYDEKCIRFYLSLLVNNSSQYVLENVTTHCYQRFISYVKNVWSTDMWLNAMFVFVISATTTDEMHLIKTIWNRPGRYPCISITFALCFSMCVLYSICCLLYFVDTAVCSISAVSVSISDHVNKVGD